MHLLQLLKPVKSLKTINDAQLPLKDNLACDCPSQPSPKIIALMAHTTNSSNLLETLTKKVQAFDKCLNDLNHQLQGLKHDSSTEVHKDSDTEKAPW